MPDADPRELFPSAGLSPTDLAAVAGILRAAYSAASSLDDEETAGREPGEITVLAALMSDDEEMAIGSLLEALIQTPSEA